jgi:MoaA/NifB/PqqE/SkfB family radical SAM enzyme
MHNLLNGYRLKDLLHYKSLYNRHLRRNRAWAKEFRKAQQQKSFSLPYPVLLQVVPTETCNLSCKMCNQWGDVGYYKGHSKDVASMPIENLLHLLKSSENYDCLLSIYGGEPFTYKHMAALLDYLIASGRDVVFTTNGTLMEPYISQLGKLKNAVYMVSVDGAKETNDRIRGQGVYERVKHSLTLLHESCLDQTGIRPLVFMNCCISNSFVPEDILQAREAARELGMVNINYELLWFFTEEMGRRYEDEFVQEFGFAASNCWRGACCELGAFDAEGVGKAVARVMNDFACRLFVPNVSVIPRMATTADRFSRYFRDANYSFARERCLYPAYSCRIQSTGDMIFCPGLPDVIAGNVLQKGFHKTFNSAAAQHLRRFLSEKRFTICNRCCGLYLTYDVDRLV